MKKFITVIIAVIALTASVVASDYVVVKDRERITIHRITTYTNNSTDVSTSELVNPAISQLSGIGLPSYCWPWVNGEDGVYDTRLMKAEQDMAEVKANYENEVENTRYLEEKIDWHVVYFTILILGLVAAVSATIVQATTIYKLKKKEK